MANNLIYKEVIMRNTFKLMSLSAVLISSAGFAGESINKSLALNDANKVVIENQRGQVNILTSTDNTVSVVGELDDKTEKFIFEQSGAVISIKVEMPNNQRNWKNNGDGSHLTIKVPAHVKIGFNGISSNVNIEGFNQGVDIKTISGEIDADKLQKHIELTSISGDIESNQLSGKIQISTVSGNIDDEHSAGRLSVKSVSGDIESKGSANEVLVETVSGDIDFSLAEIDELDISTVSGNSNASFRLNDNGTVKLSSVSGDFDMNFIKNVSANFRLKTNSGGSITNKLTDDKAERGKYVPSEKLRFTTGNGSGSVKASTVSGEIMVRYN